MVVVEIIVYSDRVRDVEEIRSHFPEYEVIQDTRRCSPGFKLTLNISRALNQRVRKYIEDTWPDSQYGKLKEVVEEAADEFLAKREY